MRTFDEAYAEREAFAAKIEALHGYQVVGSGIAATEPYGWDLSVESRLTGRTILIVGASEAQAFLDDWDAGQEIREVAN